MTIAFCRSAPRHLLCIKEADKVARYCMLRLALKRNDRDKCSAFRAFTVARMSDAAIIRRTYV